MSGSTFFGKKIIQITKGKEYQAKEDEVYKKDIFFAESYVAARDCVFDIIHVSEIIKDQLLKDTGSVDWQELIHLSSGKLNHYLRGRVNNVIAFCADRGQGKTTAMRSFAQEMEEYSKQRRESRGRVYPQERQDFWTSKSKSELPRMCFIECIDPTMMSEKDSIIKVILSRMFIRFSQKEKERKQARSQNYDHRFSNIGEREELLQQFQRCFHDAEILRGEIHHEDWQEEDDLEQMAELGDSSNLLASMYSLICQYLHYMGSSGDYLVIQIDDADMQISKTYQILDDIRRYLLLPDVIILFAANMTQLESTIEQHFLKEYEISLKISGSMGNLEYCHNVAALYLEKALPVSHRIFLPRLEDHWEDLFLDYQESLSEKESSNAETRNILAPPENNDWRIEKQLLNYLHRKTGMVFLGPKDRYHDFLPTNLRDLTHFLAYFEKLEDLENCYAAVLDIFSSKEYGEEDDWEKIESWERNLKLFQDYLVYLWPGTNLREPGRRLFVEFAEESLFNKHEYLLRNLPDYYSHERRLAGDLRGVTVKNEEDYRKEFLQECLARGVEIPEFGNSEKRRPVSSSYADVITALSVLGDLFNSSRQIKFIYAVHLYYTVCFHQILLKRLRNLDKEPSPEQNLTYFMRDGFLKDARKSDRLENFIFWRTEIPSNTTIPASNFEDLMTKNNSRSDAASDNDSIFELLSENDSMSDKPAKNNSFVDLIKNKRGFGVANLFLRQQVTDGITIWTAPVGRELKWYDIHNEKYTLGNFVFHPFYRILRELDIFTYANKRLSNNEILPNEDSYLRMQFAFVILLNWDAQYNIFLFYQSSERISKRNLIRSLRALYLNTEITNLLDEITELSRDLLWRDGYHDSPFHFLDTFFTDPTDDISAKGDINKFAKILEPIVFKRSTSTPKSSKPKSSKN